MRRSMGFLHDNAEIPRAGTSRDDSLMIDAIRLACTYLEQFWQADRNAEHSIPAPVRGGGYA